MSKFKKASSFSMGKAKREAHFVNDKTLNHVPGPNTYVPPAKDKQQ